MLKIDPKIFKAYDIRGVYPKQINEEIAYRIGQAFADYTGLKKVVVGRDMRNSSLTLQKEIVRGLIEQGVVVDDIGLVSSDTFYFALNKYQYSGGIIVTASHNPKEYGGCRLFGPKRLQIYEQRGMADFEKLVTEGKFQSVKKKGKVKKIKKVVNKYADFCLPFIDLKKIKPFKVVLDAGSGMASTFLKEILPQLPIKPTKMYFKPDGDFPFHEANPAVAENTIACQKEVKAKKADFGLSFDGDADRLLLIDEKGQRVGNDILLALVARWFLQKQPGSAVVKQIVCSKTVDEVVTASGGKTVVSRVGTGFIKEAMKKNQAIFGGEISGHFYFKDFWFFDSGLIMFLVVLQVLSEQNRPVSEIIKEIDHHYHSGEINMEVSNQQTTLERIKQKYNDGKIDLLDGVTVEYDNWWFNVRPSNTEPLLRLNIEANSKEIIVEKKEELVKLVKEK